MALLASKGNTFSSARKGLLGTIIGLLVVYAWLAITHAAVVSGMPVRGMDWNGDGAVSFREFAQAFYAVEAQQKVDGNRTCTTYAWHTGEAIRVECKTEFNKSN